MGIPGDVLLRLTGALLAEQQDEWLTADRRYLPLSSHHRLLGGAVNPTLDDLLREGLAVGERVGLGSRPHHLMGRGRHNKC